ncbi:MAG: sigma-70 family RNA polymerase sigma factor [Clostridia bacterium]|jgi:RNA polymerase sigma-70 factor (ECF subfamily)|nr:sigma-70 family RNA polymerase sigma factor [Clostridia bacterium]
MSIATVKKAVKGDETAFCQLVEGRKATLYRLAYSYVKNQEDALDIVSEAVYKAFISIDKLKNPEYFNTWLTKILINCAINQLKKSKKVIYFNEENALKSLDTQDQLNNFSQPYHHEEVLDLYSALDKLDDKHKTVIILKFFQDLTLEEIARMLDWPTGTVKTYLYRALKVLNLNLKEGEGNG